MLPSSYEYFWIHNFLPEVNVRCHHQHLWCFTSHPLGFLGFLPCTVSSFHDNVEVVILKSLIFFFVFLLFLPQNRFVCVLLCLCVCTHIWAYVHSHACAMVCVCACKSVLFFYYIGPQAQTRAIRLGIKYFYQQLSHWPTSVFSLLEYNWSTSVSIDLTRFIPDQLLPMKSPASQDFKYSAPPKVSFWTLVVPTTSVPKRPLLYFLSLWILYFLCPV